MPADRLLNTVLQYYQDVHDAPKTEQIIGTTTHLLTELSNPLNLTVLTSQLLTAPALWRRSDGLRTSLRIISIYNTAAIRVRENEHNQGSRRRKNTHEGGGGGGGLRCEQWTRAVVKGADDRSRRWQHLLVLTGVLMGLEGGEEKALSWSLRNTLEQAVVLAANMALEEQAKEGPLPGLSVVMALLFAFPLLSDFNRTQVNCNALLPLATSAMIGQDALDHANFLEAIASDVAASVGSVLTWHAQAPSFRLLQHLDAQLLMANMGPLSKLIAHAVQQATDSGAVLHAQDALVAFSQRTLDMWRRCAFSDLDPAMEGVRLSPETMQSTWPALWQVLRKTMFAVVVALQAVMSRSLLDSKMLNVDVASSVASKSLHILRNLSFISSRNGNSAFQVYTFTYMTSIDILSRKPTASLAILGAMKPLDASTLPTTHLQRTLDLFYMNLAEHLPLTLSTAACDDLIVRPATAYLSHEGPMSPAMVELFESAHSAILSALSCPQHSELTIRLAPFYIVKLLESFPHHISSRQFRVAFKTVMQIVSPPFPIAALEPHLSETLLEMLRFNIAKASTAPLPVTNDVASQGAGNGPANEPLSEQSSLVLALLDSLPFLPLPLLDEWLTAAGNIVNGIGDPNLRSPVTRRFVDMLVSGEMDVERAAIGVAWWGTNGGRELVLSGNMPEPLMSGALVSDDSLSRL